MEPSTQTSNYDDPVVATQAKNLTKAIFQHESGMDYNAKGDAGTSIGAGQWQNATWKSQAKDVLGDENAQMTPENQSVVAQGTIRKLIKEGKNAAQIAAIWNSGNDTGWENKVGKRTINGQVISYNVPKYVKDVTDLYQQYKGQLEQQNINQPEQDKGFLQNEGESVANRIGQGGHAISDTFSGKINPLSGVLQTAGAAAGGITDLAGNVLSAVTPNAIKKPIGDAVKGIIGAAANTGIGKSAIQGVNDFSTAHPEIAGDIGAIGNIAGVIPVTSGIGAIKDLAGGLIGKALGKDALSATIDSISPEIKAGTKAGATSVKSTGTSKGLLGNVTRNIEPRLKEAASAVQEIVPNFDKLTTFTDKVNAVKKGIGDFAQQLRTNLRGDIQPILTYEDMNALEKNINSEIKRNPLLKGDAGAQAKDIFNFFKEELPKGRDATMEDVLNARQKTDEWISSITRGNAFDPKTDNALSVGLRAVRQGANDLMESKVPTAGVKKLLKKQSLLYDAIDNMAPKADREVGTGMLGRFAQGHPNITKGAGFAGGSLLTGLGLGEAQNLIGGK